jgi:hypothetical protein
MKIHKDLGALGNGTAQDLSVDQCLAQACFSGPGEADNFLAGGVEVGDVGG